MSESPVIFEKTEIESESFLRIKIRSLEKQLIDKDKQISSYEAEFKKLLEDFNYNVELIFERDKDIEKLLDKVDELTRGVTEKDIEIEELKKSSQKLKQLEHENSRLQRKLEERERRSTPRMAPVGNQIDYKSLLRDNRAVGSRYTSNYEPQTLSIEKENSKKTTLESSFSSNFDLESRIKALEMENSHRQRKCSSVLGTRVADKSEIFDSDVTQIREKVKKQEQEISELISSLQVPKSQVEALSRSKLRKSEPESQHESSLNLSLYDNKIAALNEDIEKMRISDSKLNFNGDRPKHFIRPRSSFEKRLS